MSIINCVRCNRMFAKVSSSKVCPTCRQEEEDAFQKVRDFLEMNPGQDIPAIAEATGLDQAMILHMLQSGRLAGLGELANGVATPCRQCGKPTRAGKNCPECSEVLSQALKNSARLLGGEKDANGDDDPNRLRLRRPETLREKH